MKVRTRHLFPICFVMLAVASAVAVNGEAAQGVLVMENLSDTHRLDLPDNEIAEAYGHAADQNVLAAVNPEVFAGYWSVCADGVGFGYGNTYPALDGHQMAEALLWLGQEETVRKNWDYVRSFQRPDGQLPFAILPAMAGQEIGPAGCRTTVDANGGLFKHWVPGNPLRALSYPTYIQNADVLFRRTQDRVWLLRELPSINRAADFLASMTTAEGAVGGAGYYVERPTRVEYDGVTQCHAVDAFRRVAALNRVAGKAADGQRYRALADRIEAHFRTRFWLGERFAEYIHPERGVIATHGLTDVDWSAVATGVASEEQIATLWPQLRDEKRFLYGGMPTGIATQPETYEDWEFAFADRMDLAAMGRVWYIECWARARLGDADGLVKSIRRVCEVGRENGYTWRERYNADGGFGAEKYCEYPANLIRIIHRFLLGVELGLDGALALAPTAPAAFWDAGFGQTIVWRGRRLTYRMERDGMEGAYVGSDSQRMRVRLRKPFPTREPQLTIDGGTRSVRVENGWTAWTLPTASKAKPCRFELRW